MRVPNSVVVKQTFLACAGHVWFSDVIFRLKMRAKSLNRSTPYWTILFYPSVDNGRSRVWCVSSKEAVEVWFNVLFSLKIIGYWFSVVLESS